MSPSRIVGIGGSAGGLQAFKDLLAYLPADTGMCFVFVMHLGNESWLASILSHSTAMAVTQVRKKAPVKKNHVYVDAPNTNLLLKDGFLCAFPNPKKRGCPTVIDGFLKSVASVASSRAVGVVMSGLLWDGAEGIQSIRAVKGITLAQDIKSAAHAGMPLAAVATGCVDFVGSPKEIAQRLVEISSRTPVPP